MVASSRYVLDFSSRALVLDTTVNLFGAMFGSTLDTYERKSMILGMDVLVLAICRE